MESTGGCRVLVCDDTASIRKLIRVVLELEGHVVEDVDSGEAAIARLGESALAPPDLLLLDVHMAPRDGWWVIGRIRSTPVLERLPVVLVSAALHGVDLADVLAKGFDAVLAKPFDPDDLVDVVSRMAKGRGAAEGPP